MVTVGHSLLQQGNFPVSRSLSISWGTPRRKRGGDEHKEEHHEYGHCTVGQEEFPAGEGQVTG